MEVIGFLISNHVFVAPNSDIAFSYEEQQVPKLSVPQSMSTDVTVSQLNMLAPNQKVNVTGTLSLGIKEPKEVFTKTTHDKILVKEDCILEDKTGHITLHIWGAMINQLKDTHSYSIRNLTLKNFQGNTFLSTTPSTVITEVEMTIPSTSLAGPSILLTPEKELFVEKVKFITKLHIFLSCQV